MSRLLQIKSRLLQWYIKRDFAFDQASGYVPKMKHKQMSNVISLTAYRARRTWEMR